MTLSASSSSRLLTWWRYSGTWKWQVGGKWLSIGYTTLGKLDSRWTTRKEMTSTFRWWQEYFWSLGNHLSFLHQPLSLCCIQAVGFLQKALLKRLLIDLGKEKKSVTKAPPRNPKKDPRFGVCWASNLLLPAGQTACSAGSSGGCGRWLLRFAPARSAGEFHRWFYSAPWRHWWCKTWRAPDPCPCGAPTEAKQRTHPPPTCCKASGTALTTHQIDGNIEFCKT